MIKEYLEIGKIVGTHGVRGEMRVEPWCDSPEFMKRFKFFYYDDKGGCGVEVSCRTHGNIALVRVKGVETVEQAQAMRGKILFIKRSDAGLKEGERFIQDLLDCKVINADSGDYYGVISDVTQTGANEVWHIKGENAREYLIPAVPDFVKSVNAEEGVIKITPLKGIFDDED